MAEESFDNNNTNPEERYKGDYLRIYTDSCRTDVISLTNRSNDARLRGSNTPYPVINNSDSYTKVRYNLGKWTYNYFRNVINRDLSPTSPRIYAQEDTLIYGKYIVARFIFARTTDFKFEDVAFNVTTDNNI